MLVAGIDPGLSGAIALLNVDLRSCQVWDMPVLALLRGGKNRREVDTHRLAAILRDIRHNHGAEHVFLEQVWSMPGQGVSSMFQMGVGYGEVRGILAALQIPYTLVPSMRWKKALQIPAAKDGARARASQLLPTAAHLWPRVKDDGRAEAALLSLYGSRQLERDHTSLPRPAAPVPQGSLF